MHIMYATLIFHRNIIYTQGGPEIAGINNQVRLFLGEVSSEFISRRIKSSVRNFIPGDSHRK